jgi:hypothetical protein
MTLIKSVVVVWTMPKLDLPESCTTPLKQKLQEMALAGQTDEKAHWESNQISMYFFTDQLSAEEFVDYLTGALPCSTYIDSTAINNL